MILCKFRLNRQSLSQLRSEQTLDIPLRGSYNSNAKHTTKWPSLQINSFQNFLEFVTEGTE